VKPRDRVTLSKHAIERYVERVKPALSFEQATVELHRLLEVCPIVDEPPVWVIWQGEPPVGWALVSDGICVPLSRHHSGQWMAITLTVRAACSPTHRETRKKHRQRRRALRRRARG
jgi:hypothetical protein